MPVIGLKDNGLDREPRYNPFAEGGMRFASSPYGYRPQWRI
jgi:hypothetical protein